MLDRYYSEKSVYLGSAAGTLRSRWKQRSQICCVRAGEAYDARVRGPNRRFRSKGEVTMGIARNMLRAIIFATISVAVLPSAPLQARSQEAAAPYLKMAPLDQYLIAD